MPDLRRTSSLDVAAIVIRIERAVLGAERRGDVIAVADPLVAFAMLLDFERRRRAGETIPAVRLESPGGVDGCLTAALERHLPWVDVVEGTAHTGGAVPGAPAGAPRSTTRSSPQARTSAGSIGTPLRTDDESMTPLVSAAELAMLFGAVERHLDPGIAADPSVADDGRDTATPSERRA